MNAPRQMRFDVSTDRGLDIFLDIRNGLLLAGKKAVFELVPEKRSLSQNALSFALYQQVANQCEDMSIMDIRCRCKLDMGIPLLCRDDATFADVWHDIEAATTYEQRLYLMRDYPVTSKMGKRLFSEFLDEVIRDYSQQGISITMPGEDW